MSCLFLFKSFFRCLLIHREKDKNLSETIAGKKKDVHVLLKIIKLSINNHNSDTINEAHLGMIWREGVSSGVQNMMQVDGNYMKPISTMKIMNIGLNKDDCEVSSTTPSVSNEENTIFDEDDQMAKRLFLSKVFL